MKNIYEKCLAEHTEEKRLKAGDDERKVIFEKSVREEKINN
jgi:hypothetical protein